MKHIVYTCHRHSCKFYNATMGNHCEALRQVYDDDKDCKFYKKKVTSNKEEK